jgi:hypothetical protein
VPIPSLTSDCYAAEIEKWWAIINAMNIAVRHDG